MKIRQTLFQRSVASIVLLTFSSLTLYPCAVSAQVHYAAEKAGLLTRLKDEGLLGNTQRYSGKLAGQSSVNANTVPAVASVGPDEQFSQLLAGIHDELKALDPATTPAVPSAAPMAKAANPMARNSNDINARSLKNESPPAVSSVQTQKRIERVQLKIQALKQMYAGIEQSFNDTEQQLKAANMPAEILQRHHAAVAQYQSRQKQFQQLGEQVERSKGTEQQRALVELSRFMGTHQNAKPHQFTDPNKLPFGSPSNKVRKPNETKTEYQASLFPPKHNKIMVVGAVSDGPKLAQGSLPALPVAEDTAETEDIQLTPAVKIKAQELNNNPVQIYNWVRNNISFIPSYGSIQGSELTLQNKRGNAFDTASLLIALYRAAGIPARYVYGTIDVPADKVMNWVGGVTKVEAAQSLLGQGGIPNTGLASGGKVSTIRMEHVWVEAFVDYFPSRGAINKNPSTWVPMDASFKQYTFTKGMDIKGNVPLSNQDLLSQMQQGATIDEKKGYVQHLNQPALESQISSYQTQIQNYVTSQKSNATLVDIFGEKKIIAENYAILLGSLPYKTVAFGGTLQKLPESLHVRISFNLYTSILDKTLQQPALTKTLNLSTISGKRMAVTYIPASEADQQIISQYLDNPTSGLPSYLIQQKTQLRLDETLLAEYPAQKMGMPQYWTYTLSTPDGNQIEEDFKAESAVGDEIVFGVNGNGTSLAQIESRYVNVNPNSSLENLNQIALGYWARADISDELLAKQSQHVTYRQPSIGMFAIPLSVRYYFGIPRSATYKSYLIDIRRLAQAAEGQDSTAKLPDFIFRSGMKNSYLEGAVLEEVLNRGKGQAMSAVNVLKEANSVGIPIWELNNANLDAFLNVTNLSLSVKQAIVSSVTSGRIVYAPERIVDLGYWAGSAYVAVDKDTGAGAYILENGTNGGGFEECKEEKQPLTVSINAQVLTFTAMALAAILIVLSLPEDLIGGAILVAMRMLGLTTLTFSANSYAGGNCKSSEKCHRGRFQAQGGGLEASQPWAQATPLTISQARALLTALQSSLSPSDQKSRAAAFSQAFRFIENSAAGGGMCAGGPNQSFPKPPLPGGIRVDIEIRAGQAFVP